MRPLILILACLLGGSAAVRAQTLGVIGSSSAFGLDANPIADSSWVNLTAAWYRNLGQLTTLYNLAQSGASSYAGLPWSNPPPDGRPKIDSTHNVTTVLNLGADVVIVAYPSNDIGLGYDLPTWLSNLRVIRDSIVKAGKRYYIETSQPRSDLNMVLRQILKDARDSILAEFPFTLNFYDPIVDPATLGILPQYDGGTGVHVNNAGHKAFFQVAKAANIMGGGPLPLTLTSFSGEWAGQSVRLRWDFANTDRGPDPVVFQVQKSLDGSSFSDLYQGQQAGPAGTYSWTDEHPTYGKSYYRLEWQEGQARGYSQVIGLNSSVKSVRIGNIYAPAGGASPMVQIDFPIAQAFRITVFSISGVPVRHGSYTTSSTSVTIQVPVAGLPAGQYFLEVVPDKADRVTKGFTKF
ncbi:MAG TPA: SGNH/GDSL hydrolase family protein [Puia sp.]|nr:SGNH/GDSL hydrolase family protein [Puia sp.]